MRAQHKREHFSQGSVSGLQANCAFWFVPASCVPSSYERQLHVCHMPHIANRSKARPTFLAQVICVFAICHMSQINHDRDQFPGPLNAAMIAAVGA
eukprot:1151802-Pelagomonas_calceolata.AAC.9